MTRRRDVLGKRISHHDIRLDPRRTDARRAAGPPPRRPAPTAVRALAIVATAAFVAVIALPACAGRTSRCFALLDAFPGYVESREQWLVDDSAVTYTLDCRPGRDRAWISVSEATTKTFPNVGREIVPGRVYELRWRSNGALDVAPSAWPEDAVLRDARVVRRGDRLRLAPIIE